MLDMRLHLPLTFSCLTILAAGCASEPGDSQDDNASASEDSDGGETSYPTEEEGGDGDGDGDGDPGDGDGDGEDPSGDSGADTGGDPGDGGEGGDSGDGDGDGDIEPGQLTAGEWRDLDNWDFWLNLGAPESEYLTEFNRWEFDTRSRVPVVAISNGEPVIDEPVVIRNANDQILWEARTDNLGRAELWPNLVDGNEPSWPLTIEAGGESIDIMALPDPLEPVLFELAPSQPVDLDLMFVVDTTGSMGDELLYLQAELSDVINRVQTEVAGDFTMRLSVNFYRDEGDEYVVRSFPFTTNVATVIGQIAAQEADGGDDWPEAVDAALTDAVFEHDWSDSARARLMFLVLDAPPHDGAQVRASLAESIVGAAELGIRVIPLGASGIDKFTEFLLRDIDIATGATYTFLTNDSGIGGEHLEPSIGEYQVELLNDLLVRLIVEAMA